MKPSVNLIAVGPWDGGEFATVRAAIDGSASWPTAATLAGAVDQIALNASPPDLVLLAQARPGVDDQLTLERLRILAPLTRVVTVAGSWCEGELRTGRPLVGAIRLYWYELSGWWRAALMRLQRGDCPPWSEPLDDPRAGQMTPPGAPAGKFAEDRNGATLGVVAVDAVDYSVYEALAAAIRPIGWACVWQPRHRAEFIRTQGPIRGALRAGVWDGGQLDSCEGESLRRFAGCMRWHGAPVVALLDFPRAEHIQLATVAGAATILAKPYQVSLLCDELERAVVASRPDN